MREENIPEICSKQV